MITKETDLGLALHDVLLTFQRKRRLISTNRGVSADEAGPSLGYVEECILQLTRGEGSSSAPKSIKALAEAVHLERSWMSRVVSSLQERGLVSLKSDPSDGRSKLVSATPAGKQAHDELNVFAQGVMDEALADLSKGERQNLLRALSVLCDGFDAPPPPVQSDADPIDVQLARMSRATGVFGSDFLGTGLNLTQAHVLLLLANHGEETVVVRDLDALLPFDMSTISRAVATFEEEGFVAKSQSETDRRSFLLSLTKKGKDRVAEYRRSVSKAFIKPLKAIPRATSIELLSLLSKATNHMPRARGSRDLSEILIRSLKNPAVVDAATTHSKSEMITHHFAAERDNQVMAQITLIRAKGSKAPVEISISGNFSTRQDLNDVLSAIQGQID